MGIDSAKDVDVLFVVALFPALVISLDKGWSGKETLKEFITIWLQVMCLLVFLWLLVAFLSGIFRRH